MFFSSSIRTRPFTNDNTQTSRWQPPLSAFHCSLFREREKQLLRSVWHLRRHLLPATFKKRNSSAPAILYLTYLRRYGRKLSLYWECLTGRYDFSVISDVFFTVTVLTHSFPTSRKSVQSNKPHWLTSVNPTNETSCRASFARQINKKTSSLLFFISGQNLPDQSR